MVSVGMFAGVAHGRIIFQDDNTHDFSSPFLTLDNDGFGVENTGIIFGNDSIPQNNGSISFDISAQEFTLNHDLNLLLNELKGFALENLSSAPASPVAGQMYHNSSDGKTYVFNGSAWDDITAIGSTSTKVVTVGPGLDYASIDDAMTYLNSLSGGIILLSAGTHQITSPVNLSNVSLVGKGTDRTTIAVSGNGLIESFDTRFNNLRIDVNSISGNYAVDVQGGSNSLIFDRVHFSIQDLGDALINSNAAIPPVVSIHMVKTSQIPENGTLIFNTGSANLDSGTNIFVDGRSGDGVLQLDNWDVTVAEAGNVYTTGTITTIPERSIFVSENMNLQAAVNSLEATGNGGLITLLPGTYNISSPLLITGDNIEINGYGDASIINANSFTSTGSEIAAIQIGAANGSAPADGVILENFKIEVASNIHGVRVAGGTDNRILDLTIQKIAGQSGSGSTADIGIQLLDGLSERLIRPVVQNCRVLGSGTNIYFTDGIHVTSDPSIVGVWGYNQGITNALVEGNNVDYVGETAYVFIGADDSSLFNNRALRMGASGSGYGIYVGGARNLNMNANVYSQALGTGSTAIGIDSFASSTVTEDSIINNNIIDGTSNGGTGFTKGFEIGSTNSHLLRSSIQNNTIKGASTGNATAIQVRGNSDDNTFSNNDIVGGTNNWDFAIDLQSNLQERNLVSGNRFTNVGTDIVDNATATRLGEMLHRDSVNPTNNDDIADGYMTGTLWINTSTDAAFILLDESAGSAVWQQLGANGSGTGVQIGQFYDSDGNGGTFNINTNNPTPIPWDSESFPEDTVFSHSNSTDNTRVYVNDSGRYKISYQVNYEDTNNQRKNVICAVRLNGTTFPPVNAASYGYARNTGDPWASSNASAYFDLNSGDYYEIVCQREGSAGNAYLTNGSSEGSSWTIIEKFN
ncbi:hypothetical protein GF340_02930 [Candidatus Peregrinibacteria bacterium]|nr:hypothetical protein [Candidatus Peregrinibacteria bacterium]